jgi:hypothetical protein
MIEKGKSTPPQQEHKKEGLPVPIWFIAILAIATLAIVFGPSLMAGTETESSSSDGGLNQPPAGDADADAGVDVVPEEVETTTPIQETKVKLLKKLGPFTFPEYGEKVENNEHKLITQKTTFKIGDSDGGAGLNSLRDPGMWIKFPPSEKTIIMLMVYKDANGDPVSVSKIDEKTGSLYFAKTIYQPGSKTTTDKVVCDETYLEEFPKTWEVLVYSY